MTPPNLKKEIDDILSVLKNQGKVHLAKCIEENWSKSAIAYSKELNSWQPVRPIEKELLFAFEKELERLETPDDIKIRILDSLQTRRVLQTAPHLVATEGPRMLCINWLGSLGVDARDFYVVGMFSGVPFSNSFRPGRINRKEDSVNLFPSSLQDGLVYRSVIPDKLIEARMGLSAEINAELPASIAGASYTKWALQSCQNIERKILGKENLIFLDINEVITEYLLRVFKDKTHVLYKIFFDPDTRTEFSQVFPNETMFYSPIMNDKYEKMEPIVLSGNNLKGKNKEIPLHDPKILIEELNNKRLCPALILSFLSIAFLNQFKCFGSFYQVEYLPDYQKKIASLKCMTGQDIEQIPTSNLTTGASPKNPDLYPADILINEQFELNAETLFGELLLPIKDSLIKIRNVKK